MQVCNNCECMYSNQSYKECPKCGSEDKHYQDVKVVGIREPIENKIEDNALVVNSEVKLGELS